MAQNIICHPINLCRVTWKTHGKKVEDARWTTYSTTECNPQKFATRVGESIETFLMHTYIKDEGEKHMASVIRKCLENIDNDTCSDLCIVDLATPKQRSLLGDDNALGNEYTPLYKDPLTRVGVDIVQPHIEVSACMEQSFTCTQHSRKYTPVYERMYIQDNSKITQPSGWKFIAVEAGQVLSRVTCRKKPDVKMNNDQKINLVQNMLQMCEVDSSTVTKIVKGDDEKRFFIVGTLQDKAGNESKFEYHARIMDAPFIKRETEIPKNCQALSIPLVEIQTSSNAKKSDIFSQKLREWRMGNLQNVGVEASKSGKNTKPREQVKKTRERSEKNGEVGTIKSRNQCNISESRKDQEGWGICNDFLKFDESFFSLHSL